jgi:hypothetical protein
VCARQTQRYLVGESGLEPLNSTRDQNPIIRAHSTREHLARIVDDTTNLFGIFGGLLGMMSILNFILQKYFLIFKKYFLTKIFNSFKILKNFSKIS